ncbi:sulfatase [Bacteroidota bacterium]
MKQAVIHTIFSILIICVMISGCKKESETRNHQPNVLLIYTDDHAQWAVGAYGNEEVHTPNMDRLASEGLLFTQGFTKPVCSPSRAMLLTGLYSHRVNIPDYIPFGNPVYVDNGLPAGTPTIASLLKEAGYVTGLVGKWHLGYGEKYYPELFGFDHAEAYRYLSQGKTNLMAWELPFLINGEEVDRFRRDTLHTDILADCAIEFIQTYRDKPFFLLLNTYLPHTPWDAVTGEDRSHYDGQSLSVSDVSHFPEKSITEEKLEELMRQYYACVSCVDRNIGKVLEELDNLELADKTITIFIGDNGFMVGQHGLLGKGNASILHFDEQGRVSRDRGRRPNMFDDSILVPFIIRWPGVVQPGTTNDSFVSTIDILPTLTEITGITTRDLQIDGNSLLSLLQNKTDVNRRTAYFDTYDMIYNGNNGEIPFMRMIRTNDWKLILYHDENGQSLDNGTRHELFNLKTDPGELNNLYGVVSYENIQTELENRLLQWMNENEVM